MTTRAIWGARYVGACLALVILMASVAFGQKAPSPGTHITVSKTTRPTADNPDVGMFSTIQEAVNAATNGQVIEILDTEVYEEQVTIDGRDDSPWDGRNGGTVKKVVGKKNGITIRYVPSASERAAGNYKRPTIKYKDTQNQSPKTYDESQTPGELPGSSGNFETCGALRIIRAQGVTIDGIKVDGGGPAPFGWEGIWNRKDALFHANAAITLVVAGQATIRNCDLTNAYFGINVKDRNTGGVFGNPNPADNDNTVPLSGFGKVGHHLIEHNRVHNNALGFFFESAWDLGSTVRYNLVYNNYFTSELSATVAKLPDAANACAGAFLFKDMVYTPVAIHNNTFYGNAANLLAHWKVAAPHLIFNNIFGKSNLATGTRPPNFVNSMGIDGNFTYRMHNSVFAALAELKAEARYVGGCQVNNQGQNITGITQVRIMDGASWPQIQGSASTVQCLPPIETQTATTNDFITPGTLLSSATSFPATANIRWLETSKSIVGTEDLFQSVDPAAANFLIPKWDHALVTKYIKGQGWKDIGIKNSDGTDADLGAIPSTGRAPYTVSRIKPSNVVLLSGTRADANFFFTTESGVMTNPKITFLRWVAPLPAFADWGASATPVPRGSIQPITPLPTTAIVEGNNKPPFTIPRALGANDEYGFFEIVVSGKDANGNDVASDIGFLPYRKLEYFLDIKVYSGNTRVDTVRAGETYRMHVTPLKGTTAFSTGPLKEVSYDLLSDATAFMYTAGTEKPLDYDTNVPAPAGKDYNVYFTRAGLETIMGAGLFEQGTNRLVFLGTTDIYVKPGAPSKVIFTDPIPLSQLGSAQAPVINRGVDRPVTVEVQDKYGNAVDVTVPVTIAVTPNSALSTDCPNCADVGDPRNISTKQVNTAGTTGVATFTARTTNSAAAGKTFDMTASFTTSTANGSDAARLRVGRSLDRLEVFYSDTALTSDGKVKPEQDAEISGNVGDWFEITVRVIVSDTINKAQTGKAVKVYPSADGLVFSASRGGAEATEFPLTNGVAKFWVSGTKDVLGACIDVEALAAPGGAVDGGIGSGYRCEITFIKPSSSILRAIVYGDGHGRPDSLLIYYAEGDAKFGSGSGAMPKPDSVSLAWPTSGKGVVMTAKSAAISVRGDYLLHVDLAGAALSGGTAKPRGYTSVERKIVKVYGGSDGPTAVEDGFDVIDGIGPVIAVGDDEAAGGSPVLTENVNAGAADDEILIRVSEQLRSADVLKGKTLFYTKDANPVNEPGASGGDELEVLDAYLDGTNAYRVTVKPVAGGLQPGYWIRFNPSGGVADRAKVEGVIDDNKPHSGNRWAQLKIQEVAPSVKEAWYTGNSVTGKPDYAYVRFDKAVNLNDWFSDGSVNFGKNDVVKVADVGLSSLFKAGGDTLRIDLAVAFKSSQTGIRTSEDMSFTLGYASGKKAEWDGVTGADVQATDRAKPVLADTVFLYIGDRKEDGTPMDTLRVTYSERPSDAALKLERPVTIITSGGGCEPALTLLGQVAPAGGSSRFYKATYLVADNLEVQCPAFPKTGDMVRIDSKTGFGDDRQPSNIQDVADNLRQPLKVVRELKWKVLVKNNPFRSDALSSSKVSVEISPNAPPGADKVNIDATIMIFDNLGTLVLVDSTTQKNVNDKIVWSWNGTNRKGRLVGTGTYLFKALCKVRIVNATGEQENMPSPAPVVRSLGVVRGKN